ncbi:hypothetical protein [Alteromonas lipolytica]|uniref:Uncharacterized protein n=1 Tax=Alteromonas lipolytica TaxID=1856405 RepID=A0A1E8FIF0_9ALTE|nr:hypothetical protein [Alteromonas lipolytica]OFI35727.1 hypothetical protein BFC17_10595 [Alteromonas lipolytica]GGF80274.1 hypothetical protein GCM10011338_35670 [Alteromonas lipolytica]
MTKMSMWAIYWRFYLVVFSVFLLTVLVIQLLPVLPLIPNTVYHPTAFWLMAGLITFILSLFVPQGLVYACYGKRLSFRPVFWTRLHYCLYGLFGFLAAFALIVQAVASPFVWAGYKLYCQPAVLLLGPWVAVSLTLSVAKQNNRP